MKGRKYMSVWGSKLRRGQVPVEVFFSGCPVIALEMMTALTLKRERKPLEEM